MIDGQGRGGAREQWVEGDAREDLRETAADSGDHAHDDERARGHLGRRELERHARVRDAAAGGEYVLQEEEGDRDKVSRSGRALELREPEIERREPERGEAKHDVRAQPVDERAPRVE